MNARQNLMTLCSFMISCVLFITHALSRRTSAKIWQRPVIGLRSLNGTGTKFWIQRGKNNNKRWVCNNGFWCFLDIFTFCHLLSLFKILTRQHSITSCSTRVFGFPFKHTSFVVTFFFLHCTIMQFHLNFIFTHYV